jgi:hypothetical protein
MYSKRDKNIYICGYIIGVYDIRAERRWYDGIEYSDIEYYTKETWPRC